MVTHETSIHDVAGTSAVSRARLRAVRAVLRCAPLLRPGPRGAPFDFCPYDYFCRALLLPMCVVCRAALRVIV